jgi:hypothetical protein
MYAQTEVAVQEAERAFKQRKIQSEADALQMKIKSDAEKVGSPLFFFSSVSFLTDRSAFFSTLSRQMLLPNLKLSKY